VITEKTTAGEGFNVPPACPEFRRACPEVAEGAFPRLPAGSGRKDVVPGPGVYFACHSERSRPTSFLRVRSARTRRPAQSRNLSAEVATE